MSELPFTDGHFSLDQNQIARAKAWLEEHAKTAPFILSSRLPDGSVARSHTSSARMVAAKE